MADEIKKELQESQELQSENIVQADNNLVDNSVDANSNENANDASSNPEEKVDGQEKETTVRDEQRAKRNKREVVRSDRNKKDDDNYISRVVSVNRVAKVIRGGRRFAFSAFVVVGDENGIVGVGSGKGREVSIAIQKAEKSARKNIFTVPRIGKTIPHPITIRKNAGMVLLRPAAPGTGVIAGGTIRAIMECAGVGDILTKSMGSSNSVNILRATISALKTLETPETVAARRGLSVEHVSVRNVPYNASIKGEK